MRHVPSVGAEMIVTPASVEKRLLDLSKEIDEAQTFLDKAERDYFTSKTECELALAKSRLARRVEGVKLTVRDKEDIAVLECQTELQLLAIAEATVRAARGNASRIKTQIDIARSIGTSVRAALDN